MMKLSRILLTTSLLWVALTGYGAACDLASSPDSLEYSLQEDNRCEGIQYELDVSGALDFVSLSSYSGSTIPDTLDIRVPHLGSDAPYLIVSHQPSRYQLDNLRLNRRGDFYTYRLNTRRMKRSGVNQLSELSAIAISGARRVRLPTLLGTPSDGYTLVLYSVDNVKFLEAGVRSQANGRVHKRWGEQLAHSGTHAFKWENALSAPSGRYEFYYIAEIEQSNRTPERVERTIVFEHDPNWLR